MAVWVSGCVGGGRWVLELWVGVFDWVSRRGRRCMHAAGSRVIELLLQVRLSVPNELLNVILKSTSSTPDVRTVIFWFAACLPDKPIRCDPPAPLGQLLSAHIPG